MSCSPQPNSQTQVLVTSRMKGLIVNELKCSLSTKLGIRVMKSVHEAMENRPFTILISNFSRHAHLLPKVTAIAFTSRSPLALVSLTSRVAHELSAMNELVPYQEEKEPWEVEDISDSEGENTRDTDYLTDAEILAMLRDDEQDTSSSPVLTVPKEDTETTG